MKNGKMILGVMAVLLLAFGLVFVGCDDGGDDKSTQFEGTWDRHTNDGFYCIFVFSSAIFAL
jgi:hypothetical protein